VSLPSDTYDLLRNVPLFFGVSREILERHLDDSARIARSAGEVLLTPGDPNDQVFVILAGRLREHHGSLDSETITMFGAAETIGEMSILDDSQSFTWIAADTDCELLVIEHSAIWALINDSHQAARNMLNILALRIPVSERDIHNEIESRQGYAGLNHVDELTGLYNHDWMRQMFTRQINRANFERSSSSMLMLSVDQFKHYNQSHGRLGGDMALRTVAQTILTCLRPNDQAARFHGKTFAIFLPRTTLSEARRAAERLRLQTNEAVIVTPSGDALPGVTVSIGLSEVTTTDTLDLLLERTEGALHRARSAGRNCISE
jgi:diguanylate cyclase (GGDEF)-like protein